jgi:hypothetical protein
MGKVYKAENNAFNCMIRSHWQESGLNRECRLAMTDIHRLKDLKILIKASEKKLKMLQQNAKRNSDEVAQEKIILEASKHIEKTLEGLILFFESQ